MPDKTDGILHRLATSAAETMRRSSDLVSVDRLLDSLPAKPPPSMTHALSSPEINIIAEIKYARPGNKRISCRLLPQDLGKMYAEFGAAAISVLTEERYFCGALRNLASVAAAGLGLPLLRKDFIVDEYQVAEAAAAGASSYLLIVALLGSERLADLIGFGRELGMEPLVEVHTAGELERAIEVGSRIVGVNNRNLRTLEVSLNTSFSLARAIEGDADLLLVSESGVSDRGQLLELRDAGFSAFLIGTALMSSPDPGRKLLELLGKTNAD